MNSKHWVATTKIILVTFIFFLFAINCSTAYALVAQQLRVGISLNANHLVLQLNNGDMLRSMPGGAPIPLASGTYRLENSGNGIRIIHSGGNNCGVFSGPLQLVPAQGAFSIGNARNGTTYRGLLEVAGKGSHALTAINILDLEAYLQGVVPREMPAAWGNDGGMEALKAQAVAARSYTLYHLDTGRHRDEPFKLCDGEHCQVYGGLSQGAPNTDRAVAETRGMVLTWSGKPIEAFYHSSNGGYTECPANVWSSSLPYLRGEPDPFDNPENASLRSHPHAIWETEIPLGFFNNLLAARGIFAAADSVKIASVFPSGRINELSVSGGGRGVSFFRGQVRSILGLNSQLFKIGQQPQPRVWIASAAGSRTEKTVYTTLEGKWALSANGSKNMLGGGVYPAQSPGRRDRVPYMAYILEGQGRGHGIGLSKYGAYNRARAGHTYEEILAFYYPGTQLQNFD